MKKIILLTFLLFITFCLSYLYKKSLNNDLKKVYISKIVDHPALNETLRGIVDELEKSGFTKDKNIDLKVESAQGKASLAAQIASKFMSKKPDVVVGIGTVSAQSLAKYAKEEKVKLIFSSITDPVSAGLSFTKAENYKNITGVSNFIDLDPQIEMFKQIKPSIKRLGFLYNPGEMNSVLLLQLLQKKAHEFDVTIVPQSASNSAEVYQASVKLALNSDAIFVSNDNTALSSLPSVAKACNEAKIPLFVSDTDIVEQGALAALGPSQYEVGLQTGKMIADILNGKDINTIPVEYPLKTEIYLNLDAANLLQIEFPAQLMQKAFKLIKLSK